VNPKIGDLVSLCKDGYPNYHDKLGIILREWNGNPAYRSPGQERFLKYFIMIDGHVLPFSVTYKKIEVLSESR